MGEFINVRKIRRSVARARMKDAGIQRINKKNQLSGRSYFAEHWREFSKPDTKEDK